LGPVLGSAWAEGGCSEAACVLRPGARLQACMTRGEPELGEPWARLMVLGLALLYLGRQDAVEATLEARPCRGACSWPQCAFRVPSTMLECRAQTCRLLQELPSFLRPGDAGEHALAWLAVPEDLCAASCARRTVRWDAASCVRGPGALASDIDQISARWGT